MEAIAPVTLWTMGLYDPRTIGTIHLFACPKGSLPVLPNGNGMFGTTYAGEYICRVL
jgi:hypothetical protein